MGDDVGGDLVDGETEAIGESRIETGVFGRRHDKRSDVVERVEGSGNREGFHPAPRRQKVSMMAAS